MLFNCNNYNMNNSWMGLMQNSFNFLGIGGYSNFGGMNFNSFGTSIFGMNNNIFTNCYGQVDYDALAGYGVANSLMGVAGMAFNHYMSQREPKVDHKQEAKDLKSEISQKELKHAELTTESLSLEEAIKTAKAKSEKLDNDILSANKNIALIETQYNRIKDSNTDGTKDQEVATKLLELNNAKEKLEELQEEKAKQGNIVTEKSEELKTCKQKIEAVQKEIENLKAELKEHQYEVEQDILEKANGNRLTRTPDDEYAKKLDNGKLKPKENYTKSDMKTAINQFMNEANGTDAKLAKAHIICDMFNVLPENERNKIFHSVVELAQKYINDNTSNKA